MDPDEAIAKALKILTEGLESGTIAVDELLDEKRRSDFETARALSANKPSTTAWTTWTAPNATAAERARAHLLYI